MSEQNLISVIIPTYNSALFLDECISSILAQTYKNFEIIIVDGNSKDETEKIIEKYSNLKFVHFYKTDACVSLQRNYGFEKSKGDYIFFLDSDDYVDNNFLEEILTTITLQNLDVVTPMFERDYYRNNKLVEKNYTKFELDDPLITMDNFFINGYRSYIASQCKLYKRSFIEDIKRFNNINFGEDLLFNYFIAEKQDFRYGLSEKALYHYRKNLDLNDAGKRLGEKSVNFFPVFLKVLKKCKNNEANYNGAFNIFKDSLKAFINSYLANHKCIPLKLFRSRLYMFVHCRIYKFYMDRKK